MSYLQGWVTPGDLLYRRNHFPYPKIDPNWRLTVTGRTTRTLSLSLADLKALPRTSLWAALECAGNKRGLLEPAAAGEPWGEGAVGNCEWAGVSLAALLHMAELGPDTVEVLFTGADQGPFPETGERVPFARSLPLAQALDPDVLLAFALNGDPLPLRHGAPLRLIVPGWYGMASVKWLTRIELLTEPFRGPFQARDYLYIPAPGAYEAAAPVTLRKVNGVITQPARGARLPAGVLIVRGVAWGGARALAAVHVSLDGGETWAEAELTGPEAQPYAWRLWQYRTEPLRPGRYLLMARATDDAGTSQPLQASWNAKGYGNNAIAPVGITLV